QQQDRTDEALAMMELARAEAEGSGDEALMARTLTSIAGVENARGHFEAARSAYARAIEVHRKLGADKNLAVAIQNLAWVDVELGDVVTARRHAEEAMALQEQRGFDVDLVYSLDC